MRINDISVSRTHSCLLLSNDKIHLIDYKSKFGTLVLLQKQVEINENKLYIQIGRTLTELVAVVKKEKNGNKTYPYIKRSLLDKMKHVIDKATKKRNSNELTDENVDFANYHLEKTPFINLNGILDLNFNIDEDNVELNKLKRNPSK